MKLKSSARRHIEAEMCEYHRTLAEMEALRRDIILAGGHAPSLEAPPTSQGVSIVERRATILADSLKINEMARITGVIHATYGKAGDVCRQVVWARFGLTLDGWHPSRTLDKALGKRDRFQMTVPEFCELLGINDDTFHCYKIGFVYGVAESLGWY